MRLTLSIKTSSSNSLYDLPVNSAFSHICLVFLMMIKTGMWSLRFQESVPVLLMCLHCVKIRSMTELPSTGRVEFFDMVEKGIFSGQMFEFFCIFFVSFGIIYIKVSTHNKKMGQ